jgi:hypothetical protein
MNPEELELYKELQPVFLKVRGDWQLGDPCMYRERHCVVAGIGNGEKLLLFTKKHQYVGWRKTANCLWIPPFCDDERPERCLLGMLMSSLPHALPVVEYDGLVWIVRIRSWDSPIATGITPTIALLRAIKAQEDR